MDSTFGALGILVLRLGAGGLLLFGHGLPKLLHFGARAGNFPDPLHVGSTASLALVVFAEVFCAPLVMLGLLTRLAVVPILIFLLVALLVQHAHDPWGDQEFVLLYLLPFLVLLCTGPGRFGLDSRLGIRWWRR